MSASDSKSYSASHSPPTARQAVWNYLVFALSKSSTLIMTVVLARLLDPAEFGLFALALLVINLFDYVKDLGVGAALVQSPNKWDRMVPTALSITVALGVVIAAVVASTAGPVAHALNHAELESLIRVLAFGLLLSSLSIIPAAWLRRNIDFRRRLLPEFLGALVKTTLTIGLAVGGLGVWSLAWGQLAGVTVTTVMYWAVARAPIGLGFDRAEAVRLLRFGAPVTCVTLLAFAIYNVDYLAIGVQLGDTQLGLYTLAYRLPELILLNLCIVVSEVLFSSLSRLQHDGPALARHYMSTLTVVVALTAPVGIGMAVAAPAIVGTLYGPQYADAAGVTAILSLYALVYSLSFHSGDVYKAIGRPGILTAINASKLAVMIWPVWWAAGHGITGVALTLLLVEVLHCAIRMFVVCRVVPITAKELIKAAAPPLLAAALMGGVVLGVAQFVTPWPAPAKLILMSVVGAIVYAVALQGTAPRLILQLRDVAQRPRRADRMRCSQGETRNPPNDVDGELRGLAE